MKLLIILLGLSVLGAFAKPVVNIGPNKYIYGQSLSQSYNLNQYNGVYELGTSLLGPTDLLQKALSDIGSAGGGILTIGKGTYTLSSPIDIPSKTHVNGAGKDLSVLKLKDYANQFSLAGFVQTHFTTDVIVSNITIDGNKVNQYQDETILYGRYGFFSAATDRLWLDNVKIINWNHYGFDPHGDKDTNSWGHDLTISNCVAQDNDWDGFTLDMTIGIEAYGNLAFRNGRHGFNVVTGARNVSIWNNVVLNNGHYYPKGGSGGCGITVQNNQFYGTHTVLIQDNQIDGNKRAGVCLNDVYNIQVTRNNILNTCLGFHLTSARSTQITNNVCAVRNLYQVIPSTTTIYTTSTGPASGIFLLNNVFQYQASCVVTLPYGNNYYTVGYNLVPGIGVYNVSSPDDAVKVIQTALNDISTNGGGVILIKAGTYPINGSIILKSMTTLRGESRDATILKLANYVRPFTVGLAGFLRARLINNFTVSDMTLDGNKLNQFTGTNYVYGRTGMFSDASTNGKIVNLKIINFQHRGMDIHGWDNGNIWGAAHTVKNCTVTDNNNHGIYFDQMVDISVTNSYSAANGGHGIIVNNTLYANVIGNTANNNGYVSTGCGITVSNNNLVSTNLANVDNNTVAGNKKAGYCLTNAAHVNFKSNVIKNGCICFSFSNADALSVTAVGNVCTGAKLISSVPTYTMTPDNTFQLLPCI